MVRPRRCRRICRKPEYETFAPVNSENKESVDLQLDEYETIRLIDLEGMTQQECANQMQVSRTTVTAIYDSARHKIAECMVLGKQLRITGGDFRFCENANESCCHRRCCSFRTHELLRTKENNQMRIAVCYNDGFVFQHFGKTEQFKIYDIENGKIANETICGTNGAGHGALAGFLKENGVDTLICGGLGMGARNAIAEAGIELYAGISGPADAAVMTLLAGNLKKVDQANCDHHGEGHECDHHNEEEHHCGHCHH